MVKMTDFLFKHFSLVSLISFVVGIVLAHTCIVPLAIIGSAILGLLYGSVDCLHFSKDKIENKLKVLSIDTLLAAVFSQIGWVALLI